MTTTLDTATIPSRPIALAQIRTDCGTQARVKIKDAVVREYADAMKVQIQEGGLRFPAVVVFTDGENFWLGDGFHRVRAAGKAGLNEILAEIRQGGQRDALLFSISANAEHGLPRTNADKRHAVLLVLNDPEWRLWSDREIARRCQVGNGLVSRLRSSASVLKEQMRPRKVRRGDQVYEMEIQRTENERNSGAQEHKATAPGGAGGNLSRTDLVGLSLGGSEAEIFNDVADFRSAEELSMQLAETFDRLARKPTGQVYREHLKRTVANGKETWECSDLRKCIEKLTSSRPYCSACPYCYLAHAGWNSPECKTCRGRGWTTKVEFESCPENLREQLLTVRGAPSPLAPG
jgi:hypothetical protein